MKRLRSYGDDLDKVGEKGASKDWGRRGDQDPDSTTSSSHHRRFHSKIENGRKGGSSSSSYNRGLEDDREASRSLRKRLDHDSDGFDRRKSFDRYRDDRGVSISSSPRMTSPRVSSPRSSYGGGSGGGGGGERMHRSESFSFSGSRRDYPKGFRSERDRPRREESVSSWRRLCGSKEVEEDGSRSAGVDLGRGSSRGRVRSPSVSREVARSPSVSREVVKSPPLSRGSSRSSEVKKNDDQVQGEGSSSSSEMEEGELEPEPESNTESKQTVGPEPETEFNAESKLLVEPEIVEEVSKVVSSSESPKEHESKNQIELATNVVNEENPLSQEKFEQRPSKQQIELTTNVVIEENHPSSEEKSEHCKEGVAHEKKGNGVLEIMEDAIKETMESPECEGKSEDGKCEAKEVSASSNGSRENTTSIGVNQELSTSHDHKLQDNGRQEIKDVIWDESLPLEQGQNEKENTNLEVQIEHRNVENRREEVTLNLISDNLNGKDKGKSLAISSLEPDSMKNYPWVVKDFLACRDDAMEGPSTRGFELFSSPVVIKSGKTNNSGSSKDEKMKVEPLELSLGLPDVLLPLNSHDPVPDPPSSPGRTLSIQSLPSTYRTTSDGFTGSMSFSGSQTFFHNPSCSLTQNSFENYEQSVGSHPIFQGIDWSGQSLNEPKRKETSNHQRVLLNGNGSHTPQTSQAQTILFSQAMQGQQHRVSEGSTGGPVGLDRQSSLRRQLSGVQLKNYSETRSPTQSGGSRETRSEYSRDKKHMVKERSGSLFRSNSQKEVEQLVVGGNGFVGRIIGMIVSDPVQTMARRIQEMAEHSIAFLKESACEIVDNKDKRGQLQAFQDTLQNRSDLTLEVLLKSHRAQLEILVAFKTGLQDFLRKANDIPSSDLAEIFLNLKCRNISCLSLLPVDECDCKVCVQKNGFCSACMCLICSKFDMAMNTCSWVGCDVCLHWCHTECGIRESYIRNGRSANGSQEKTEMQFHCVACNHPSEMFGFVKEVFKTCAKEWSAEILSKELEYVKRIFSASNDIRGNQLHLVAERLIARLENKSNLSEVYTYISRFFTESNSEIGNTSISSLKEQRHKNSGEGSNGIARPSQESMWLTSVSTENAPQGGNSSAAPPRLDWDRMGGLTGNQDMRMGAGKKPVMDELESIVRIKQAEAKMFQARADDARREAEGLKRIVVAKNDKIETEYSSRITKLRLAETEEKRKQKLEELQVLEREHREYFSMKMRMEADIRDLLLKMEATKQNFIT